MHTSKELKRHAKVCLNSKKWIQVTMESPRKIYVEIMQTDEFSKEQYSMTR